eukprot:CAMPEP_0171322594 /NCGR_PEP_ID=MMETSP0816-20121228/115061_1 /TAXON_ID=420281 /ORGANISM="Proboscia inermis, Strain CCAP1064/1" /LENGTH=147 /DNA_ID=CAMNT_0011821115 /DNA_START=97 /DNA_END=540 /DNA_ORIENTATION=+
MMVMHQISAYQGSFTPRSLTFTSQRQGNRPSKSGSSSLKMLDMPDIQVLKGTAIALAGVGAGIGFALFTEDQGERGRERGTVLSERMSTQITGGLMEDVEVSSVGDLNSLTSQLEAALKESGGVKGEEVAISEEEKRRMEEEAEDGW